MSPRSMSRPRLPSLHSYRDLNKILDETQKLAMTKNDGIPEDDYMKIVSQKHLHQNQATSAQENKQAMSLS